MVSKVGLTVYSFFLLIVDTHNEENPANLTESVSNVSDSGVSFTTSSSVDEQQKLIKIDVQHKSDQTEEKMDINCLSDQTEEKMDINCLSDQREEKMDINCLSDQKEEKMDINCLSDQREDRTSEPCQQTTRTSEPCQQTTRTSEPCQQMTRTSEPCQQTTRTSEPCQQTTWFEKNEQDQIAEPCIKHEDTTMCHTNVSENILKYSPQRETSKYSPQREKQVAMITPFKSENGKFFVAFHI